MPIQHEIRDNLKDGKIAPIGRAVTEKDFFVPPALREDLDGIVATVEKIKDFGSVMGHRNYLLTGAPGTGKTLGVLYIATKLNLPVYDGKTVSNAQQVMQLFKELRRISNKGQQKVILMLDEIDRFTNRDEVVDPSQYQTLNQLLVEMDGTDSNEGIFVFGMTNKPNKIDGALRRAGRFSKEIEFMPPDKNGREAILVIHANGKGGHKFKVEDKDIEYTAGATFGYTGADLRGLLDEAFTRAAIKNRTKVTREDLDFALKRIKPSALRDMPFVEPKVKLADVSGYELHKELVRIVMEKGKGATFLFYGPKGTGKSYLPEAVAGQFGYNFIVVRGNDPENKFVGATKDTLKEYIERAKRLAPCVLLFDEIGSLVAQKVWTGGTKEAHTGYLQSVLSSPPEGVFIFGTENNPERLLDTFVDRFLYKLYFGMPTAEEQLLIWRQYLPAGVSAEEIVTCNSGLSPRAIANASRIVTDWGVQPTVEVFKRVIEGTAQQPESDYAKVIERLGNSVEEFRKVREFMKR